VRKASLKRIGSDVDVVFVVEPGKNYREPGYLSTRGEIQQRVKSVLGVELSLIFSNESSFGIRERDYSQPFQVLYGKDFVKKRFNRHPLMNARLKEVQRGNPKYSLD